MPLGLCYYHVETLEFRGIIKEEFVYAVTGSLLAGHATRHFGDSVTTAMRFGLGAILDDFVMNTTPVRIVHSKD